VTTIARAQREPIFVTIADGLKAQVVERRSPLPQRLDPLLSGIVVLKRFPVTIVGARQACTDASHELQPWLWGIYANLELRLSLCAFCGMVEVRDISFDVLPGAMGHGKPRRRDAVLGWYTGKRPAGRTYL